MTADNHRKRKQDYIKQEPGWSDFVYSSPSSPPVGTTATPTAAEDYNQQQQQEMDRRHSLTVGEMHFHSFDMKPQYNEIEQLLGASLPSSWSSSSSNSTQQHQEMLPHRRALSLRLDTPNQPIDMHRASISTASPTTPAFFSPSFLDALKQEDDMMFVDNQHHFTDDIFMYHQQQQHDTPSSSTTITPSCINTEDDVNNLTNWLLNQPPAAMTSTNSNLMKKKSSSTSSNSSMTPPLSMQNITSTPSPPSTMTSLYQQQHPSIPEEEDEDMDHHTNQRGSCVATRIIQDTNNASIMKPLIQKYLANQEDERKVMILTSKVAQKSYGTEKRFLCPPPSTLLSGASWYINNATTSLSTKPLPPRINVHITGEKTSQNGVIEWKTEATKEDDGGQMIGHCVSKHLHINDADEKRKRVEVIVKIDLGNDIHLGSFASKSIKVISKPSKKRQSVKNMELCIHHGTTISLFNRIRSQTVSTKYLGVSSGGDAGTCFVARTGSWDPFVIWIVDITRAPDQQQPILPHHPENPHFPAPPAIALQTTTGQAPIALHYNQAIVLQCVTTGLVSPVMVIRKVDKGSMIMGGNRLDDLSGATGGECGDEALGDPVSQLHKIAFQIVQDPSIAHHNKAHYQSTMQPSSTAGWTSPQTSQPVTYLACLDNVVGMHKTTTERNFVVQRPISNLSTNESTMLSSSWSAGNTFDGYDMMQQQQQQQQQHAVDMQQQFNNVGGGGGGGKMTRKRRVSCDVAGKPVSVPILKNGSVNRRRVNSLNDAYDISTTTVGAGRRGSVSDHHHRRSSITSDQINGACWTEDVSDASVWTIVGTDCASYKFWTPPAIVDLNAPFSSSTVTANPITPFPVLTMQPHQLSQQQLLHLAGENFSRDISVWFGDVKSPRTEYKSRESISCVVPDFKELVESSASFLVEESRHKILLLFVRGDGVVYNTDMFYSF